MARPQSLSFEEARLERREGDRDSRLRGLADSEGHDLTRTLPRQTNLPIYSRGYPRTDGLVIEGFFREGGVRSTLSPHILYIRGEKVFENFMSKKKKHTHMEKERRGATTPTDHRLSQAPFFHDRLGIPFRCHSSQVPGCPGGSRPSVTTLES